ncbi:AMP-binding protein [Goekera deserti]|uniref:Fatty acyl-AMP ligase n=1 Tax=Goekera deserti TaxID=2497753 RepID=A0A7K3WD88_9ACTN|nr:AMP-binding protein [Goekera deserti]NDI46758.1 AMP-binding protein [Goekera deserti]NEL54327.1 fatty acyl-AMP ligase [Goekera deserti]
MTAQSLFAPPALRFGSSTLPALLRRAAASDRGYTVLRQGEADRRLSFAELSRKAAGAAAALRQQGMQRGDRVCLLAPTSAELLVAIWGVWAGGGVVVVLSLPTRLSELDGYATELTQRLEQAGASVLVVADEFADMLPSSFGDVRVQTLAELDIGEGPEAVEAVTEADLAVLQFTSGTTARSRAVALTHGQLLSNVSALSDALALSPADRGASWLPLFHDMGLIIMVVAVAHPGDLVLIPTEDFARRPGCWMDAVSRFRATVTVSPSTGYALAAKDLRWRPRDLDLSALRIAGNGAEPIDPAVLDTFAKAAGAYGMSRAALCPMYGLAEVTLAATVVRPDTGMRELSVCRDELESARSVRMVEPGEPGSRRLVACGTPVPGTTIEIRDGDDALPPGRVGEIYVHSPSTMSAYWRDPEGTADVLHQGWLRTGDLGFMDGDDLVVCGRSKDMIIVGGRNLYPEDYEQLAAGRAGVRRGNVVAFGLPESERMVVVAESRLAPDEARRLAQELLVDMTRELSHAPEEVLIVQSGALPKTSSGKVQRDRCRQRYRASELPVTASATRT